MKQYDSLKFDATDAWLMFAIWLSANGHRGETWFAFAILIAILWADARAEREAKP